MASAAEKPKRVVGRPFQKGVSGNPGGVPKGPRISTLIAQELSKPTVEGSPMTKAAMIAAKLVNMAQAGDLGAIKEVVDRLEGKSVARNETGEPGAFDADLADWSDEDISTAVQRLRTVT